MEPSNHLKFGVKGIDQHNMAQSDALSNAFDCALEALMNGDFERAAQICDGARDMFKLILKGSHPAEVLEGIRELRHVINLMQRYGKRGLSLRDFSKTVQIGSTTIVVGKALMDPEYNNDIVLAALDVQHG